MKRLTVTGLAAIMAICLIFLTGCWNRRELNELAIAAAIGMDTSGDEYSVTIQVINPGEISSKTGGGARTPVVIYRSTGSTIFEALRRMTVGLPRKVYLSHLRVVVVGEALAREGLGGPMDVLSRFHEVRSDFFIVIARNRRAAEVLETLTTLEKIPGNMMYKALELSDRQWAATGKMTLDNLISDMGSEGKAAAVTGIEVVGNAEEEDSMNNVKRASPRARLRFSGMAFFKKDKLAGWLNESESKGFNYTQGNVRNTIVNIPCPGNGKLGVELIRTKSSLKVSSKASSDRGETAGTVSVHAEGNLAEAECKMDVMKPDAVARMERETEEDIEEKITAVLRLAQRQYKTDIFGFGQALHRSDPDSWKKLKKDWNRIFASMDVKVTVDVKIRRLGSVNQPLENTLEE